MYSLKANGEDIVSAAQRDQIQMIIGRQNYPKALQDQLIGLKEGDKKTITLMPDQAFGSIRPELLRRVMKKDLPKNIAFAEGQVMMGKNGQPGLRVVKVLDDSVVFDQNHPLAGKTLVYNVQIANVD
jgi:FKBP-type peptidyl-prolyl cis-trans isomerase 2